MDLITTVQDHNVNPETNEIYLHSHINDDYDEGIDFRCSTKFIKNFNLLDTLNDKPIIIHLNSPGGLIDQGFAIYDLIKQSRKQVCIIGYGIVASMASVILQAADTRLLMPNSSLMVHNATLSVSDTPTHGLKSYLKLLGRDEDFMLNLYAEKCVNGPHFKEMQYSLSKVRAYIRRKMTDNLDWYLNSIESYEYGFIDGIIGERDYPSIESIKKV